MHHSVWEPPDSTPVRHQSTSDRDPLTRAAVRWSAWSALLMVLGFAIPAVRYYSAWPDDHAAALKHLAALGIGPLLAAGLAAYGAIVAAKRGMTDHRTARIVCATAGFQTAMLVALLTGIADGRRGTVALGIFPLGRTAADAVGVTLLVAALATATAAARAGFRFPCAAGPIVAASLDAAADHGSPERTDRPATEGPAAARGAGALVLVAVPAAMTAVFYAPLGFEPVLRSWEPFGPLRLAAVFDVEGAFRLFPTVPMLSAAVPAVILATRALSGAGTPLERAALGASVAAVAALTFVQLPRLFEIEAYPRFEWSEVSAGLWLASSAVCVALLGTVWAVGRRGHRDRRERFIRPDD